MKYLLRTRHAALFLMKDLHRFILLAVAILLFEFVRLYLGHMEFQRGLAEEISATHQLLSLLSWGLVALAFIPLVVYADNPHSSNALVHTRPIDGTDLALGKVAVILLVAGFLPALAHGALLVSTGLPLADLPFAVGEVALARIGYLLPATFLASALSSYLLYVIAAITLFGGMHIISFLSRTKLDVQRFGSVTEPITQVDFGTTLRLGESSLLLSAILVSLLALICTVLAYRKYARDTLFVVFVVSFSSLAFICSLQSVRVFPRVFSVPLLPPVKVDAVPAARDRSVQIPHLSLAMERGYTDRSLQREMIVHNLILEPLPSDSGIARVATLTDVVFPGIEHPPVHAIRGSRSFTGCFSERELVNAVGLSDSNVGDRFDGVEVVQPARCGAFEGFLIPSELGSRLACMDKGSLAIEAEVDFFAFETEFKLDSEKPEVSERGFRARAASPRDTGMPGPTVLLQAFSPLGAPGRRIAWQVQDGGSNSDFDRGGSELNLGLEGSDTLVVVSVSRTAGGNVIIESLCPTVSTSSVGPFWWKAVSEYTTWRSCRKAQPGDFTENAPPLVESQVYGFRVRFLERKKVSLKMDDIPIRVSDRRCGSGPSR